MTWTFEQHFEVIEFDLFNFVHEYRISYLSIQFFYEIFFQQLFFASAFSIWIWTSKMFGICDASCDASKMSRVSCLELSWLSRLKLSGWHTFIVFPCSRAYSNTTLSGNVINGRLCQSSHGRLGCGWFSIALQKGN